MNKYLKSKQGSTPRVYEISTVNQFIDVAFSINSDGRRIFRGQTTEIDWPLVPSVGREGKRSRLLWREEDILDEFKRESIPYIDYVPRNNWQWLALAQHNRLPTRLLDWSKNPLVALWFAVKDATKDTNPGIVWAYHYEEAEVVSVTNDLGTPFMINKTFVYLPEHVSRFIQAQSGVFTVHHREGNDPGWFPPLDQAQYSDLSLIKIEVSPMDFTSIRTVLSQIGINAASLFPGLSGLVDRIRYENILCREERI